jgi:DNA polymerase/3'-5' exonuclease PolX
MNKNIIEQFEKLIKFVQLEVDNAKQNNEVKLATINTFRLSQIKKSLQIIKKYPKEISDNLDEFGELSGIGKGTINRIKEILKTNKLAELDNFKEDENDKIIEELETIVGVGRSNALAFIKDGIKSVQDLKDKIKQNKIKVNDKILLGVKYHNKFFGNIPRSEITKINTFLTKKIKEINIELKLNKKNEYFFTICGSYRRKKPTSGDIDILVSKKGDDGNLKIFIDKIREILVDDITDNYEKKYMGFAKYDDNPIRRIDIRYIPNESYYTALLYFTGSVELNKKMRQEAKAKGFKLSEYGLFKKNKKLEINSEYDIFKILEIPYIEPRLR